MKSVRCFLASLAAFTLVGAAAGLLITIPATREVVASDEPARKEPLVCPGDWPQWGGSPSRNNTPDGVNIATDWDRGSPLIVDGKVYIADEDGDVAIFPLTADPSLAIKRNAKGKPIPGINQVNMGNTVYSTPVVAHNVLYISNRDHLFAIQAEPR